MRRALAHAARPRLAASHRPAFATALGRRWSTTDGTASGSHGSLAADGHAEGGAAGPVEVRVEAYDMYNAASQVIVDIGEELHDALSPEGPGYFTTTDFVGAEALAVMREESEAMFEAGHFAENYRCVMTRACGSRESTTKRVSTATISAATTMTATTTTTTTTTTTDSEIADDDGVMQRVLKEGVFSTELEGGELDVAPFLLHYTAAVMHTLPKVRVTNAPPLGY